MPLVKQGKISGEAFVHVADDAEIPAGGAVLISAARFLADPDALSRRLGKTGVIWPNNRDVDDLVPHLDRLAVIALVFPTFRDGRAYSQARLLKERIERIDPGLGVEAMRLVVPRTDALVPVQATLGQLLGGTAERNV